MLKIIRFIFRTQCWKLCFWVGLPKIRQLIPVTPVNFQRFLAKCCTVIGKLFSIISYKLCLNRLRFSYFIIKRVWLQFFLGHALYTYTYCSTNKDNFYGPVVFFNTEIKHVVMSVSLHHHKLTRIKIGVFTTVGVCTQSCPLQCWNYKQVNGRAAMASDSERRKKFTGPLWEGPHFCKFFITPTTDFIGYSNENLKIHTGVNSLPYLPCLPSLSPSLPSYIPLPLEVGPLKSS